MTPRVTHGSPDSGIVIIVDHASNMVPADLCLGVTDDAMASHIAVDIGAAALADTVSTALNAPAIYGPVSRLVIDLNREEDSPGLIPLISDGIEIFGNKHLSNYEIIDRLIRFYRPYHEAVAALITLYAPRLLVSVHSFTPQLACAPKQLRPWQLGILYNQDDRAARIALPLLRGQGIITGDNQPYSGRDLNATMNRHAEGRGLPYLGIEVRQDLLDNTTDIAAWGDRLAAVIAQTANALAE